MYRSQIRQHAKTIVDFLDKKHDRQPPVALAALVNVDYDGKEWREWNEIVAEMGDVARSRTPALPLTWVPDLSLWTVRPLPGDFLANACWDLAYVNTRTATTGRDSRFATKHVANRKVQTLLSNAASVCASQLAGMRLLEDTLRDELVQVREQERLQGLI